jgi:malonate transporter
MAETFESIFPIFLLILAGNLLRRAPIIDAGAWRGLEQLGFWVLYPVLLFNTIYKAIGIMGLLLGFLWPVCRNLGLIGHSQFSSVFQTSIRWNGFMAFAIAEKVFPPEGIAIVALMMATIIIPVNLLSIYVLTHFAARTANWAAVWKGIATNPLILASLFAVLLRMAPFGLYPPIGSALDLVGRAALGMGLIAIGAGLRPGDLLKPSFALTVPVAMKLIIFPILLISLSLSMGVNGHVVQYLALCAAVPTAMNGYLLARQMGGDAELYAAVTTLQTAVSFLTIPFFMAIAAYITGG